MSHRVRFRVIVMFVVVSSAFIIITGSFNSTLISNVAEDDQEGNVLNLYRITVHV
jgi:hypothetical protein